MNNCGTKSVATIAVTESSDLDRRSENLRSRFAAVDRLERHDARVGRRLGLLHLRSRRHGKHLGIPNEEQSSEADHKLHRLRREGDGLRPRAIVFEQAGYVHELDPKSGKSKIVNITAAGDFPWMMPNWEDVSNRLTNMAASPTGKRVVVEARGEIFTIPADKGDVT